MSRIATIASVSSAKITPLQATAILGVSLSTIYRLIKDGSISALRVRKSWLIEAESVQDFIEKNTTGKSHDSDPRERHPIHGNATAIPDSKDPEATNARTAHNQQTTLGESNGHQTMH